MKRSTFFSILAVLIFATTALAGTAAFEELKRLATQGDPEAQFTLGLSYATGQGTDQDYKEAARWIRLSAEQGIAYAQDYLGGMYEEGKGVDTDPGLAAKYYLLAARQGNSNAQENIGRLYAYGRGVPQNFVVSYMWLTLAVKHGNSRAISLRSQLAKHMSSGQIGEAESLAADWKAFR